jgi:hypothetical protein
MQFPISATTDGGVIVTELYQSKVWVYHSPPVELDLSGRGVTSIGGLGGSYFQSASPDTTSSSTTTTTSSSSIPANSTTTTTISSRPCAMEAIYGENAEQTELLREYRDNVLSKTPEGQETIKTYNKFSPDVTKLLEQMPLLKKRSKAFIDIILPGIRKKVEESNKQ